MERKIGEIFEYNGEWYQCVEGRCKDCHFSEKRYLCKQFIVKNFCLSGIIFKKLEKVGESYMNNEKIVQKYKIYHDPLIAKDGVVERYVPGLIDIVIKQNKEDMEENKTTLPKEDNALTRIVYAYVNGKISDKELIKSIKEMSDEYSYNKNNLTPFSLELAKQGKPVCTRDGRKARILCYDLKGAEYPIVAAVEKRDSFAESVFSYDKNGRFDHNTENNNDLIMLLEKKEGWVNIYKNGLLGTRVHDTKKEALDNASPKDYIATVKIKWEE